MLGMQSIQALVGIRELGFRRAQLAIHLLPARELAAILFGEVRLALALFELLGEVRNELLDELADANERLNALHAQHARLTRFWHYFKRRTLEQRISHAQSASAAADSALAEARAASEALEKDTGPEFPGVSVDGRRAINTAAIAYAEVLCLRLVKTQLVSFAREATSRREVADNYGLRPECEALMAEIGRARAVLQARTNIAQEVKVRSERLKQVARYRNLTDTSPTPESIAFSEGDVLAGETLGASAARMPNVLAEDTWDLFRVLLR